MHPTFKEKIRFTRTAALPVCFGALVACTGLTSDNGILPRDDSRPMVLSSFVSAAADIDHSIGRRSSGDTVKVGIKGPLAGIECFSDNPLIGVTRDSDAATIFTTDSIGLLTRDTSFSAAVFMTSGGAVVDSCRIDVTVTLVKPAFAVRTATISHIVGRASSSDTIRPGVRNTLPGITFTPDCPLLSAEATAAGVTVSFGDPALTLTGDTAISARVFLEFGTDKLDTLAVAINVVTCPDERMKLIPAAGATFMMGSGDSSDFALPVHAVTFTHDFWMDSTEVTLRQYIEIMHKNPSQNTTQLDRPVDMVTWYDAALYCNERSKKMVRDTVYAYSGISGTPGAGCTGLANLTINYQCTGFRLPTEAQWEFACRAQTTTAYYWGDTVSPEYCWYEKPAANDVARLKPNAFGLYDMSGNIYEWTNDTSRDYSSDAATDPAFPPTSSIMAMCIIRGGSWKSTAAPARSAFREEQNANLSDNFFGFRCVVQAGK